MKDVSCSLESTWYALGISGGCSGMSNEEGQSVGSVTDTPNPAAPKPPVSEARMPTGLLGVSPYPESARRGWYDHSPNGSLRPVRSTRQTFF